MYSYIIPGTLNDSISSCSILNGGIRARIRMHEIDPAISSMCRINPHHNPNYNGESSQNNVNKPLGSGSNVIGKMDDEDASGSNSMIPLMNGHAVRLLERPEFVSKEQSTRTRSISSTESHPIVRMSEIDDSRSMDLINVQMAGMHWSEETQSPSLKITSEDRQRQASVTVSGHPDWIDRRQTEPNLITNAVNDERAERSRSSLMDPLSTSSTKIEWGEKHRQTESGGICGNVRNEEWEERPRQIESVARITNMDRGERQRQTESATSNSTNPDRVERPKEQRIIRIHSEYDNPRIPQQVSRSSNQRLSDQWVEPQPSTSSDGCTISRTDQSSPSITTSMNHFISLKYFPSIAHIFLF